MRKILKYLGSLSIVLKYIIHLKKTLYIIFFYFNQIALHMRARK